MAGSSPTVRRRRLASELRRLREEAGLTIEQVAERMEVSSSKISRIETARVSTPPRDVRDLLDIYEITGPQRLALLTIAREARQKNWLDAYSDLSFAAATDMELAASSIRIYSGLVVPGVLQTADYARAVLRAIRMDLGPHEIEHRVELRRRRHSFLVRGEYPAFSVVMDEAALRRAVGGPEVMRAQLQHLVEAAGISNVTFQVLPFRAGAHAGMDGEFTLFSFAEAADHDVVYLENTTSDVYREDSDAIRRYNLLFDHLKAKALDSAHSVKFLAKVAKELS